ncbi:MAG: hypothetical protein ACKOE4_01250, partial [Candidatus Kapaibacterium sp.]
GQPDDTATVRTTITGRVVDDAGKSVQGALVRGHGASTTTNTNGVFVLQNVTVPSTRAMVTVTKSGYFTGARAAYPSDGKITTMMLTLQQATQTRTVSSASGGKVTVGSASIDLPANGYVDAQGNSYSGTVSVAARYLDPQSGNFYDSFSGDMAALRADGSSTELVSYGVLRVLLTGAQGQPLNLAKGAAAILTYPAAGAADVEIPLWHFDLTQGIWVEEGKATLSGGVYTGTVTHFTDWNLDKPNAARAFIEGRVTCGENLPLAGIVVDIGQVSVVTDQDGMYRRRVPADFAFDVQVKATRNEGISCLPVTVSPIAENQTKRQDLVVSPCPTLLEAQFVDCSDAPIGGFLQVITPTGVKVAASSTGKVRVTVPAGVALTLEGYSTAGRTITSTPVAPIAAGALFDAGNLKACSGVETKYTEFALPNNESARYACLSADGSRVAIVTQTTVFAFEAGTGAQLWSATLQGTQQYATSVKFVNADQRIAVSTNKATTVYVATTGQIASKVTAQGRHQVTSNGAKVYVLPDSGNGKVIDEYNAADGTLLTSITLSLPAGNKGLNFMGMQGDGLAILQTYSPMAIYTVELETGNVLRTYTGVPDSSGSTILGEAATLSPSGKVIVTMGARGTSGGSQTNFVDLISGNVISTITSGASVLAISTDDAQYVGRAYTTGAPVTLSDLRTQQLQRILPAGTAANDSPIGFSFSADGSRLVGMNSAETQGAPGGTGSKVRVYQLR